MSVKPRVLVMGVLLLAWCGCQKGTQQTRGESPDMAEAAKADARSSGMSSKSRTVANRSKPEAEEPPAKADTRTGTLTQADNGMELDFRQGQTITVALDSNRASGLSWALVEPIGSVIVPEGGSSYAVKAGKNAGGVETWRFRAAKPGFQTVKLEYRRKWAQSVPERTYRFSGRVR